MELSIIYPTHKEKFLVTWVELQSDKGSFVIAKGHAPMILSLAKEKQITYQTNAGIEKYKEIKGGIAHITRKHISILVDA